MRIRNIFLVLCMLLPLAVRAQFVEVGWSAEKGDSLLPLCTSVVDLPADYASYIYTAHVEYPEYVRMTGEVSLIAGAAGGGVSCGHSG